MYSWTFRQDAMNRSLIFIENSSIYHMVRSLSFRIASPRICTVFRRFCSVGLFFLKYFSVSFGKNHGNWIPRSEKRFCVFLSVSWPYEFPLKSVQVLWISVRSTMKRHFAEKSTPPNNRIIYTTCTKGRDRFHWAATPLKPYKVGNIFYMTYRYSVLYFLNLSHRKRQFLWKYPNPETVVVVCFNAFVHAKSTYFPIEDGRHCYNEF